jgi:hypothetical protein
VSHEDDRVSGGVKMTDPANLREVFLSGSDRHVSECIVDLLMHEVGFTCLECPECGHEQQYSQEDLLMFLPGGRQCPVGMRLSSKGNAQQFGTSDSRYIVGKKQGAG